MQNDEQVFISLPGRGNPWFQPFEMPAGESLIDMRLIFGVISLLESGSQIDNPNYQFNGEDQIAGRPGWKISELDQQMTQVKEMTIDQETGFILRSIRNPEYTDDREEIAYFPQEVTVMAIEFNVDFPQHLFNPRLPWRGGYAWDHSGEPYRVLNIP